MDDNNNKIINLTEEERIRAKYWEDNGIDPEETYSISLRDLADLYPVKNYPSSSTKLDK